MRAVQALSVGACTYCLNHLASLLINFEPDDWHPAGQMEAEWTGQDDTGRTVAAGVYLATLESGNRTASLKVVLLE